MQRKIGIVVVSYHNPDMTTRYVSKELPKLTTPYTLVVVNVAATREESSQLAEACGLCFVDDDGTHKFPDSQGYLIWDNDNLGYAKGNNKGVRFLNSIGTFSHYLFSNDDIKIINTNILDVLISRSRQDKYYLGNSNFVLLKLKILIERPDDAVMQDGELVLKARTVGNVLKEKCYV